MENNSKFAITYTPEDTVCWVTYRIISEGDLALKLNEQDPIWISLTGIYKLPNILSDPPDESNNRLARYEGIKKKYTKPSEGCFICEDIERKKINLISFGNGAAWIHIDCINQFIERLKELCENNRSELASVML